MFFFQNNARKIHTLPDNTLESRDDQRTVHDQPNQGGMPKTVTSPPTRQHGLVLPGWVNPSFRISNVPTNPTTADHASAEHAALILL